MTDMLHPIVHVRKWWHDFIVCDNCGLDKSIFRLCKDDDDFIINVVNNGVRTSLRRFSACTEKFNAYAVSQHAGTALVRALQSTMHNYQPLLGYVQYRITFQCHADDVSATTTVYA